MAGTAVRRTASLPLAYVPAIHVFPARGTKDVDARHKAGHDELTETSALLLERDVLLIFLRHLAAIARGHRAARDRVVEFLLASHLAAALLFLGTRGLFLSRVGGFLVAAVGRRRCGGSRLGRGRSSGRRRGGGRGGWLRARCGRGRRWRRSSSVVARGWSLGKHARWQIGA